MCLYVQKSSIKLFNRPINQSVFISNGRLPVFWANPFACRRQRRFSSWEFLLLNFCWSRLAIWNVFCSDYRANRINNKNVVVFPDGSTWMFRFELIWWISSPLILNLLNLLFGRNRMKVWARLATSTQSSDFKFCRLFGLSKRLLNRLKNHVHHLMWGTKRRLFHCQSLSLPTIFS